MRDIRKHVAWYLHGFPAGAELRRALALVKTLGELDVLLDQLDPEVPVPRRRDRPARASGFAGLSGAAGRLVGRPRRLHGAGRRRRDALRWVNRDDLDITSLRMSQYDMSLVRYWLQWRSHAICC